MNTYYVTLDCEGDRVRENASIRKIEASSPDEAAEILARSAIINHADFTNFRAVLGDFGDCWIKTYGELELFDCEPFEASELYITGEGSHPGGKGKWITPIPRVYAVNFDDIEEVDA